MIEVTYEGVNITGSISINRCYHDMYAAGQSDTLFIRVNDAAHLWDSWSPKNGDKIRIDYGAINTGKMYVFDTVQQNGKLDIIAQSAPRSGYEPRSKAWQKVRLSQIGQYVAERNGLRFESYGVEDWLYPYILQENMSDFGFLNNRAMLEGCAFLVYDGTLILYSEKFMEEVKPSETLTITPACGYKYNSMRTELYGSCAVESGLYRGEFSVDNGSKKVYRPTIVGGVGSNEEAVRFARNLLRAANKSSRGGCVNSNIFTGYAAASTVLLENERAASWNGPAFIEHIRNDYGKGKSKIFFRPLLEGY